eukprot:TRINITY_DN8646_c0_g1_i2.p2 TRINITY_DN8646_c0_g1~~TRINITY_DN8646_c0_g1_i2.p2  ORF type:complete len:100 (+),score=10.22 TRINITY_DN8646_c0_g1_i2:183-482(+)
MSFHASSVSLSVLRSVPSLEDGAADSPPHVAGFRGEGPHHKGEHAGADGAASPSQLSLWVKDLPHGGMIDGSLGEKSVRSVFVFACLFLVCWKKEPVRE